MLPRTFQYRIPFRTNKTRVKRTLFFGSLLVGGLGGALLIYDGRAVRFVQASWTALLISIDYKIHFWNPGDYRRAGPDSEVRKQVDLRTGQRLLALCLSLGGVFIKAGQFASSLERALPKEIVDTLSELQDHATPLGFKHVRRVFLEDLGLDPDQVFEKIEETPVAAASLAQVHRAVLKETREEVAVKVQYPHLARLIDSDLGTMSFITKAVSKTAIDADFTLLFEEFKEVLLTELNFENEGRRSERVAANFRQRSDLYIPLVHWDYTSKRILVMEYIRGCKVSDTRTIQQYGFGLSTVARIVNEIFGEMVYIHGFVHCDPHPGNIFVRPHPQNPKRPQIVLLDHGLYRDLDEGLRKNYCLLWRAFLRRNEEEIKQAADYLGMGRFYKMLPLIFTFRHISSDRSTLSRRPMDQGEKDRVRKDLKVTTIPNLAQYIVSFPKDILLVLRNFFLLRSLNMKLGQDLSSQLSIACEYATRGFYIENSADVMPLTRELSVPLRQGGISWMNAFRLWFELIVLRFRYWYAQTFHSG